MAQQGKSLQQLEKEVNALLKLMLSELETCAALPPEEACDPYTFNERRHRLVRKTWNLFKEALCFEPSDEHKQV